ncbi:MAG: hypothetical protein IJ323_00670 [Clostridia bacterium]|nr:hypothetical protein [Clostridia bacterium]
MKNLLEELWNKYLFEKCAVVTEKERSNIKKEIEIKNELMLTKENEKLFENYLDLLYDTSTEREKTSFLKGIQFGVQFIVEALGKK